MMNRTGIFLILVTAVFLQTKNLEACTGITLTAKDSSRILARTIEWGNSELSSQYVIVPHGHKQRSYIPGGLLSGMEFTAQYGYVGLAVEQREFVVEGLNEAGLSAGLFYFPKYGEYEEYNATLNTSSISDLQLVSWILGTCKTIGEVQHAIKNVHIIGIDPRASTVHWRFADSTGRQVVLEIIEGEPRFHENKLGVLTNSPAFDWHMTNLNNYINLFPGTVEAQHLGDIQLASFGAGSGFLGMPGDVTPPSRFIRAAFYQMTAPMQNTALETILQSFQILNNFDIPIGVEFAQGELPPSIPSATQWTSATDITNRIIYYRTMHNSTIRKIDLNEINFESIAYQALPLDQIKEQPIAPIKIH